MYLDSAKAFCKAIELRCPFQAGMSHRVAVLSDLVGEELHLDIRQRHDLKMAAYLRDIGLCAVPYQVSSVKSPQEWTERDFALFDQHPDISGAMLELVPGLKRLAPIVRNHHLSYRSQRSPKTVIQSLVPTESFILSAVSAYVRYEKSQGALLARDQLITGRGIEFDPAVVDTLLKVLPSVRGIDVEHSVEI